MLVPLAAVTSVVVAHDRGVLSREAEPIRAGSGAGDDSRSRVTVRRLAVAVSTQTASRSYPCEHCREDFRESVEEDPPSLGSRTHFALWLCRQHNRVNEKLGKAPFPCEMPAIDKRWKYGGPECWSAAYDGYAHETLGQDIDGDD